MKEDPYVYQETIERLEPDIAMIDDGSFNASAAISLKRIADSLERLETAIKGDKIHGSAIDQLSTAISDAIFNGIRNANP